MAAAALGFLVAGKESLAFWTHEVFHTTDKVGVDHVGNQSILGVLTRLDAVQLWPLLAVFVVVLAITGMRRAEPTLALGVNALAVLLVSPISWSHHWVWCVPIVLAFAKNRMRLLAVIGAALFISGPHWWVGEESLAVNAYAAYAVIALAVVALTVWHRGRLTAWTSSPSDRFLTPASTTGASSPPPSTRASVPATSPQVSSS
jgi:alpha-1,2-mannosyltransferase